MTLLEVCEWLETFELFEHYYIGKIDGSQQKVLGVYTRANGRPVHALGQPSSYDITGIKLLVHWSQDEDETQTASKNLFKALTDYPAQWIDDNNYIYYVDLQCQEPIDVGMDTNLIYEYVINLNIYSNRRN